MAGEEELAKVSGEGERGRRGGRWEERESDEVAIGAFGVGGVNA